MYKRQLCDMAMKILHKLPQQVKMVSAHVDGIYYKNFGPEREAVQGVIDLLQYPDGTPMFHIKAAHVDKMPTREANWVPGLAPREPHRSFEMRDPKKVWTVVDETAFERNEAPMKIAEAMVENQGGILIGLGGTGKSEIIKMMVKLIKLKHPEARILIMTIKHAVKAMHDLSLIHI